MARKSNSRLRELARNETARSNAPFVPGGDDDGPILGRWGFLLASIGLLVVLVAASIYFGTAKIEGTLEQGITNALRAQGVNDVDVAASGTEIRLTGTVSEELHLETVPFAVSQVRGVSGVKHTLRLETAAAAPGFMPSDPMVFDWADGVMRVVGTVSSQQTLDGIVGSLEAAVGYTLDAEGLVVASVADESAWISTALTTVSNTSRAAESGNVTVNPEVGVVTVSAELESRQERSDLLRGVEDVIATGPLALVSGLTVPEAERPPTPEEVAEVQETLDELIDGKVVEFETGSDQLTVVGIALLEEILVPLREHPNVPVEIGGHTDDQGTDDFNLDLSRRRAEAVLDYLIDNGELAERFVVVGYGEGEPVAGNDTDEGRARNRRIEFLALLGE